MRTQTSTHRGRPQGLERAGSTTVSYLADRWEIDVSHYQDDVVSIGDDGVTIKSYRWPGNAKRIEYGSIRGFESFEMGFWTGRHRLVGMSFGRPRNWFHWDRHRGSKRIAISLDVGKWTRPTIVPDDPKAVEEILRGAVDPQ